MRLSRRTRREHEMIVGELIDELIEREGAI